MTNWILSSSVLITVLIALRYLLRGRISLRLQYALWALALVRLLIPVSFGSTGLSVNNLSAAVREQPAVQNVLELGRANIPTQSFASAYAQVIEEQKARGVDVSQLEGSELEALDYEAYELMNGPSLSELLGSIARYVWLSGIAAVGLCLLISNLRFAVMLRKTRRERADVPYTPLRVYVSDAVEAPCLFGLFRPSIYITPEVMERETVLRHALEHETTHFYHGDHIWAFMRCLCLMMHWYHPLVWLAAALSQRDAELACDEGTIKRIGEGERISYGSTLIDLTCEKSGAAALFCTATTMNGSGKSIKERISLIARRPKMLWITAVAVVLLAALAVGCTFTGAKEEPAALSPWEWAQTLDNGITIDQADTVTGAGNMERFVEILNGLTEEAFIRAPSFAGGAAAAVVHDRGMSYPFILPGVDGVVVLEYDGAFWRIESPELYAFLYAAVEDTEEIQDQPVAAVIEIAPATDELLAPYADYDEIDAATDEFGNKLLLTADRPLRDFNLFNLTWNTSRELIPSERGELYHAAELTPDKPLVVWGSFPGAFPTVGFSYTDADGTSQSFHIIQSGEDGSVLLQEPMTYSEQLNAANLWIAPATDEMIAQYASYDEIDAATDEYGNRLLLTTNRTLHDFSLFRLIWDETVGELVVPTEDGGLYHAAELTPDKPLVVWVSFPGIFPTVGLSYTDADGTFKRFHIGRSGEDGSVRLTEA